MPLMTSLSTVSSSPKYSFGGKTDTGRRGDAPGPGAYTSTGPDAHKFNRGAQYGFGSAPRESSRPNSAPGPGQYMPSDPTVTSSRYGFGTSGRSKGAPYRADQPGPGHYNHASSVGSAPKYTATGRRDGVNKANTPGPGSYQAIGVDAHKEKKSAAWGFSTSPRNDVRGSTNPGPGSYDKSTTFSGPQFSMRAHLEPSRRPETPGPGAHGAVFTQFG